MKWLICIDNRGYEASLECRKLYEFTEDSKAAMLGLVRVIDESGDSYLYDKNLFADVDVPAVLATQLLATRHA